MRTVHVSTAQGAFQQLIEVGPTRFVADEQKEAGGDDLGPAPHEILRAALGACTSMTLSLYARRKGWPLRSVKVSLDEERPKDGVYVIRRAIHLEGDLTD